MSLLSYKIIGSGKPIVLLHGFMENQKMWNFIYENNTEYKWILIDLPGHGNSDNYFILHSMEFMAEKVKQVLDYEKISDAFFISHSMGGYVTLAFLELFKEYFKGICMFFSSPLADTKDKKEQRLRAFEVAQENLDGFIKVGVPNLFNQNLLEDLEDEIKSAKDMAKETSLQGITAALLGMRERKDRTELLKLCKFPILFLCGTFDSAVPSSQIKQLYENVEHITYKELPIGHMGHLEAPESCEKLIMNFIHKYY